MQHGLRRSLVLRTGLLVVALSVCVRAQSPSVSQTATAASDTPSHAASAAGSNSEVATVDNPTTFRIRVNVIQVRVVVRDQLGKVIDDLKKEDFQLLDNNKPQIISTFAVEHPATRTLPAATDVSPGATAAPSSVVLPDRFVALVFDDIHLSTQDALFARTAAGKILDTITPADRVAIYSTSSFVNQDYTKDIAVLREMLLRIIPRPLQGSVLGQDCPSITQFQAEQILLFHNPDAINVADANALACAFDGNPKMAGAAATLAQSKAAQVQSQGEMETDSVFRRLEEFVRTLSGMPGQRIMAFISPGFASMEASRSLNEAIDRAVKANVVVDTIDARGLYTPDLGDISQPSPAAAYSGASLRLQLLEQSADGEILGSLAQGTGGTWFHNRNDLDRGIRQVISAPSSSYVLSFSPQNLKLDGHYHTLKVKVGSAKDLVVQARHGYFAPKTVPDPASQAEAEIEEALVSQDELNEIPIELKTQFFMKDSAQATLSVLAHFDVKSMHFRKADGRNFDELVLATAIFDQNGHYVIGGEKTLKMRMFDATLARVNTSGLTVKSTFDLKPGTYLVRLVVRDTEGAQMAARNGAVEIPF